MTPTVGQVASSPSIQLQRAAMVMLLMLAGCAGSGGSEASPTILEEAGGEGGGGGSDSDSSSQPTDSSAPRPTGTGRPPTGGGDGFHLELTYTYSVSLEVIEGATGTTTGVDTFEGDLLPVDTDPDGRPTRYEGTFDATATGSSEENVLGTACDAEWAGEQELLVVAEVVEGAGEPEIDLTFKAASAPTYEVRTPGGDICPGTANQIDVDGAPMLPFSDSVIVAGVPLAVLQPTEPGSQTIPIEGTIPGAEVDAEWHALWTELEG